jgi:hypothetical protein
LNIIQYWSTYTPVIFKRMDSIINIIAAIKNYKAVNRVNASVSIK